MRFRFAGIAAVALVLLCGVAVAAEQGVKVTGFNGKGVVQKSDGSVVELKKDAILAQGDIVSIGTGALFMMEFEDGSVANISGPARFGLDLVSDYARTIRLYEGTINRLEVKEVTTGIVSPGGAFAAAQNGSLYAKAEPGAGGQMRTTFNLLAGDNAKGGMKGGDVSVMSRGKPMVFDVQVPGVTPRAGSAAPQVGDGKTIQMGIHDITYFPPGLMEITTTASGGMTMKNTGGEGEYAMVTIDDDTTYYLAGGETVEFGPDGFAIRSDGVVHVEAPLSVTSFWFDPVRDPAGSSFTGSAIR